MARPGCVLGVCAIYAGVWPSRALHIYLIFFFLYYVKKEHDDELIFVELEKKWRALQHTVHNNFLLFFCVQITLMR